MEASPGPFCGGGGREGGEGGREEGQRGGEMGGRERGGERREGGREEEREKGGRGEGGRAGEDLNFTFKTFQCACVYSFHWQSCTVHVRTLQWTVEASPLNRTPSS